MRGTRPTALAVALATLVLAGTRPALATHFRYSHLSWSVVTGRTIEFTLQSSGGATTPPLPVTWPSTDTVVPCSGGDGFAIAGDVIREDIGDTRLDFGDGSPTVGSPHNGGLFYLVTSVDPVNNWLFGLALDTARLPVIDTTIQHTYAATGTYTALISSCCRIQANAPPNAHINNPEFDYQVQTVVEVG
jgi:hypothetical protein